MNRTTPEQRRRFFHRHLGGETYQEIADDSGVSKECVRYWCRRQRDGGNYQSRYQRSSPGILSSFAPIVRYVILRLKLEHPRWGRERIYYHLSKRRSCRGQRLPSPPSIGRYLHQFERFQRPKAKVKKHVKRQSVSKTHECWQLDFKRELEGADEQKFTLHTIIDQHSGACIDAQIVPKAVINKRPGRVTWREAQHTLRGGFTFWNTLPLRVQTDNESTLAGRAGMDFPTDFTLWLVGLGIIHAMIRPGISTDNAEVERGHRTITDYALIGQEKRAVSDLQLIVETAARELTFSLPSRAKECNGRIPIDAYPDLLSTARLYQLHQELALFDMKRVDHYLAQFQWQRKVSKNGTVQLGGSTRRYSLGRKYAYQQIQIRFDAEDRHLVFFSQMTRTRKSAASLFAILRSGASLV